MSLDEHTIEIDLDCYTAISLRDLAMLQKKSQAVAESLRVLLVPGGTFLERRAAAVRAREALAAFDAMPDVLA